MKRLKIPMLYLLSLVLSIAPVTVYASLNWDRYVTTVSEGIRLGCGGSMLLIIVLLKVTGRLKMPSRTALFGLVFILSYLLKAVLNDLLILSFLALVGELMDSLCGIFIRRAREEGQRTKNAEATASEIRKALNGRV